MNYPKISIVTPSFNQGQFLEETIQSVLNQNYPNLEYIIIDGGSTDNSVEIIQRYEKYLTFWVSEKDKGQSDAINKGLQHCTGELFNWLNSDDFYEPQALFKVAETFMQNPDIEVVCGKERAFYHHDRTQIQIHEGTPLNQAIEELIYNGIIDQPPTFFRKTVIDKLGLLSTDLNYRMDSDWWISYLLLFGKDKTLKINDILTNFRLHQASKSSTLQETFYREQQILNYAVGKLIEVPLNILEIYFVENKKTVCSQVKITELHASINVQKLTAIFCRHSYPRFYMQRKYAESRLAFMYYLKFGEIESYPKVIVDFIKLILFSTRLINYLRDFKKVTRS